MARATRRATGVALLVLWTALPTWAADAPDLVAAARRADATGVRGLLAQGADVHATEADGTTALHWAVQVRDRATVELLLRAGAPVDATNRYGVTPLSLAARGGDATLVEDLLAAGARIDVAEAALPEGQTLLMHAARTGDARAIKALVAAGSDVQARESRTGTTALVWAAANDRTAAVEALAETGADLNAQSTVTDYPHTQNGVLLTGTEEGVSYVGQTVLPRGGWSPVMFAAREGATGAVEALARAGADLDLQDPEGTTALIIAVINGHWAAARALVEHGADVNRADIKGMTPLYAAVDMHTLADTFGRPFPPRPIIDGSVDAVRMLVAAGADVNAQLTGPILKRVYDAGDGRLGKGATALMRAARKSDVALMRLLLDGGADVALAQESGNTPLMLAAGGVSSGGDIAERVSEEMAIQAIRVGLAAGLDVNAVNAAGDTVLHTAVTSGGGLPTLIQVLVDAGARLDLANTAGRTPLDAARRARQPNQAVIALLEQLGAPGSPQP